MQADGCLFRETDESHGRNSAHAEIIKELTGRAAKRNM